MTDDRYRSPLGTRYASAAMQALWGDRHRIALWRRLWLALAETERELGLDIAEPAIAAMRAHLDDADLEVAAAYERRFRHDVMAHVHAFGDQAAAARGVIHLGATSAFVTDNADLVVMREGLRLVLGRLVAVVGALETFATRYASVPCLAYTHFQPAQLTTVGKRATLWMQDLSLDIEEVCHRLETLRLHGCKGTTGTQASFLELFKGDDAKVRELDRRIAARMGFSDTFAVTGQTYPRKVDSQVLDALSGIAQSTAKMASDLRLLQHEGELLEPFESEQIGSSAMAYKRNPMRAERICSLARFVISLQANGAHTAANQWLERTLDDSANRRLTLPEAFLATDAILVLATNIAAGLEVREAVIQRHVDAQMPFMATERWLMLARGTGWRPAGAARGDPEAQHDRGRGAECRRVERPARPPGRGPRVCQGAVRGPARGARAAALHRSLRSAGAGVHLRVPAPAPCACTSAGVGCHRGRGARMTAALQASSLPLPLVRQGKVREVYDAGPDALLLVASDRVSAFDVVMHEAVPYKGAVLTQISAFWFRRLEQAAPSHFITADADEILRRLPALVPHRSQVSGRAMLVRRTTPVPFECVVRGYLSGSAWAEYRTRGTLAGEPLPAGLLESARLEPALFSPATKAESGHDENVTFITVESALGADVARQLRTLSFAVYTAGRDYAAGRGIIIADTKFEFGFTPDGRLLLIDEVLTPDSSRFWPADRYVPGRSQPSFDKQPLRDYLAALRESARWNGEAPPPTLPGDVIEATSQRYLEAYRLITGHPLPVTA